MHSIYHSGISARKMNRELIEKQMCNEGTENEGTGGPMGSLFCQREVEATQAKQDSVVKRGREMKSQKQMQTISLKKAECWPAGWLTWLKHKL